MDCSWPASAWHTRSAICGSERVGRAVMMQGNRLLAARYWVCTSAHLPTDPAAHLCRLIRRVPVQAAADRRESEGGGLVLVRQCQAGAVGSFQQRRRVCRHRVGGADSVHDVASRQQPRGCQHCGDGGRGRGQGHGSSVQAALRPSSHALTRIPARPPCTTPHLRCLSGI